MPRNQMLGARPFMLPSSAALLLEAHRAQVASTFLYQQAQARSQDLQSLDRLSALIKSNASTMGSTPLSDSQIAVASALLSRKRAADEAASVPRNWPY